MLLGALTLALYGPTLYFDFVWDDTNYILNNYWIQSLSLERLRDIWTRSYLGNYAPLHLLAMAIVHSFGGLEPFGFHLAQFALHTACVCLLYFVLKEVESVRIAWLASLLFALYPANIENVAWVSEIKTTLALLFFLLSFWAFHRLRERGRRTDGAWSYGTMSAGFLILSLLSKINTVVAPAIFLLYACKDAPRPFWDRSSGSPESRRSLLWTLASVCLIAAVFVAVHYFVSYGANRLSPGRLADAAITDIRLLPADEFSGYFGGFAVHLLNLPAFLFFYIRMVFFPDPLSAWQMFPIRSGLDGSIAAAWIALFGLAWIVYRSPRHVQFWMLWFFLFLSPVLQLIPNGIWVADRYLYVPVIGAFVLVSKLFFYVLDRLRPLWQRLSWEAMMLVVLFAFAWQTHGHLPVWRNDLTLWEATTRTCTTSAYCHYRLGFAYLDNPLGAQVEPAVHEFSEAARLRPVPVYWIALADSLSDYAGDYPRALEAYRIARESGRPLSVTFLARVAKALYLSGDLEQARSVIADGQRIQPDNSELLLVQGFVEWKLGNHDLAKEALGKGLALNAVNPLAAHPARFLNDYWKRPAEVGRILSDLGPFLAPL